EAAGQFCEDEDCRNAYELTLDVTGALISSRDVTTDVLQVLRDMIDEDRFTTCPHPLVEDHYTNWEAKCEDDARMEADHLRQESMSSIFI
ncbi:unnamed protein product, partial [Laminaria digitata]